ncbi:MAG: Xaa-Pro peptidase family protein [Planctomycetota bacterium]
MSRPSLDLEACRRRQSRLRAAMEALGVELAVLTRMESIQWLTGARVGPLFQPVASIDSAGRVTLVLPSRRIETPAAADEVAPYEEKWLSTMRDASDQRIASIAAWRAACPDMPRRVGCEFSSACKHLLAAADGEWADLDATMFQLRRRKDADELAILAAANEANRAMYQHAREAIEPGINEIDLYAQLHALAVKTLGEPLTYFGQDFRSAARGGAPRDRTAQAGELYILDLGVGLNGYHTDNARTIAVGGEPTDAQQRAWKHIAAAFPIVEANVKPGASCRALFEQVRQQLAEAAPWAFNHHLGHGVGLAPHEGPHLNPNWDDTFQPGDYIAVEPGLYHEELNAGIRLEQNYVVTDSGAELLTDWPLGL